MDSQVTRDGRLLDIVDKEWKEDCLPFEDIAVPQLELPELEPGMCFRYICQSQALAIKLEIEPYGLFRRVACKQPTY